MERHSHRRGRKPKFFIGQDALELDSDNSWQDMDDFDAGKQVVVGICAMEKKTLSKPMKEILTRLEEFEYIKTLIFPENVILEESVEEWPICDCLIAFHSKGFPLDKAILYAKLRQPFIINNLAAQFDIQDRRAVYNILSTEGIELPRYAILDRDSPDSSFDNLEEQDDHVEVNGVVFNKPFVEKPVDAEDHNIIIYYPASAGGGSQRLFRKIGSRSSVYSPESLVRRTGSYIYEDFMATDGTDVKVYTVGPDYAHAEARKSPALDGKVERNSEGKEVRYPVILSSKEKLIARKVCLAFKQTVCGFDLLRANGRSYVCDVNGFSFVKNSSKYYDDCAKILGNMILRELAPTLHIPWTMPFQLDDPPIVPTTVGKMMELRCVVAVIRHGDRTPKQKMKLEVKHPMFFDLFNRMNGYKVGHVKLKKPKHLQQVLDIARFLIKEIEKGAPSNELIKEKISKLEQIRYILEMYGHFSGINRKVQLKYQPKGRPKSTSSEDDAPKEPSLLLVLKWGGELTPTGRVQAEELGKVFRCMYPGGQDLLIGGLPPDSESDKSSSHGEYAGTQGLGLLRLHSTYRHDLKIYASDEGRVQMTAAAFAKGLLALEGELTPILVQMVKSANTNGLLDNDCDSSPVSKKQKIKREPSATHSNDSNAPQLSTYFRNMAENVQLHEIKQRVKSKLHEMLQRDQDFSCEDESFLNPSNKLSITNALRFIGNPVKCCNHIYNLIQELNSLLPVLQAEHQNASVLYHCETWELMARRWGKLEKDFLPKTGVFDISKVPDIYDCIKYDIQHNRSVLHPGPTWDTAVELYTYAKNLADVVIPQEYGMTRHEKLTIAQGICTPLLRKIRADLQHQGKEDAEDEDTVNRLNPRYSSGVSSPGRHVRTRLYFTSESHIHSLLTIFSCGGLVDSKDEQWNRAMEYVSLVSELNYMTQIVIMLYEDPTKEPTSDERFHVELHFSPGVNCCVEKELPPGPGFRPHSRNHEQSGKNCPYSWKNGNYDDSDESWDHSDFQGAPHQHSTATTLLCSKTCNQDQVKNIFSISQREGNQRPTTVTFECDKRKASPGRAEVKNKSRIIKPMPSFQETDEGSSVSSLSDPIAIKKTSLEASIEQLSPASSSKNNLSRSFDESSRPSRSLENECLVANQESATSPCSKDGFGRRSHRHSLPGHKMTNYLKFLQDLAIRQASGTMASQLFSTAVISGSSSAPNLLTANSLVSCGVAEDGSSTIRPLETLHNALSLRQLDNFLEFVTTANFKTPSHTPPRVGEMPEDSEEGLSLPKLYPKSLAFISPQSSFGWSTSCSQPISGNSPPHLSLGSDLVMMADSNPPSLQLTEVLPMDQILPQQPGQEQRALAGQEKMTLAGQEQRAMLGQELLLSHQSGHPMSSQVSPHELLSKVRKLSEEQK